MGGKAPRCQARFVNRLRAARGGIVTHGELAEAIWGDDPEGGPLAVRHSLKSLARALRKHGYPVASEGQRGYRFVPTVASLDEALRR